MSKVFANGVNLYYEEEGVGPLLLLISGYTTDHSAWDTVRQELAKHFHLYLLDNRGVGRSDSPDSPYTIEIMADDAKAFIEALHLHKPHVVAHSMGGAIAQTLAFKHPDLIGKLVLANTLIRFKPTPTFAFRYFLKMRSLGMPFKTMVEGCLPWLFSSHFMNNAQQVADVMRLLESYPYVQSITGQTRQLEALLHFNSDEWFTKISSPTLVIEGGEDLVCPEDSQRLAKGILNAQLISFAGQRHMAHVEIPKEFTKAVVDFLK